MFRAEFPFCKAGNAVILGMFVVVVLVTGGMVVLAEGLAVIV